MKRLKSESYVYTMANWKFFWRSPVFQNKLEGIIDKCQFIQSTAHPTAARDTLLASIIMIITNTIFNPGVLMFEAAQKIITYFGKGIHLDLAKAEIWCDWANKALEGARQYPLTALKNTSIKSSKTKPKIKKEYPSKSRKSLENRNDQNDDTEMDDATRRNE